MSVRTGLLAIAIAGTLVPGAPAVADQAPQFNSRIVVRLAVSPGQAAAEEAALSEAEPLGAIDEGTVVEPIAEPEPITEPDPWAGLMTSPAPPRATIGGESRTLLAASERRLLTVRPTQVATGGRLFVYGKLPGELADQHPPIEVMLRRDSGWQRERVVRPAGEGAGPLGFTLVVVDIEPGPVLAAMSVRGKGANGALISAPFEVPAGARLRLGFGLDEWDWSGLAPVTVSVVASVMTPDGSGGEEWEVMRRRLDPAGLEPGWFDEDIDLASLAGDRISLSFRTRVDPGAGLLAPQVVWSRPSVVHLDRDRSLPPSFAVVWADSLRARSLSCCGSERATSPYVDGLFGSQGLVFDHAIAQAADTRASTMSLFVSMYPSAHRVVSESAALSREAITLAEAMSSAGYATAAFVEGGELAAELGFGRGFDVYYEEPESDPWHTEGHSTALFGRMLEWLERHQGQPRFAFVHSYDIGWPYLPHPDHQKLFDDDRLDRPSSVDQGALVRYEREIRGFDDSMREFLPRFDAIADPTRTLLMLSSAHGEEFGEHGVLRHGSHLYEEIVHVPLMLRGLGLRPGSHYRGTVGHIDLAPTILGLAGLEVPPSMTGTAIGKALTSGLPFTVPERLSEAHAGRRLRAAGGSDGSWTPPWFTLLRDDHKVILGRTSKGRVVAEAYDLLADPEESSDLLASPSPPGWTTAMLERLESHASAVWKSDAGPKIAKVRPSSANRSKLDALER